MFFWCFVFWAMVLFLWCKDEKNAIHRLKIHLAEVFTEGKPPKKSPSFHDPQRCFFGFFWKNVFLKTFFESK